MRTSERQSIILTRRSIYDAKNQNRRWGFWATG